MSFLSCPEPIALLLVAALRKTVFRWGFGCPSLIRFQYDLFTYCSRLICPRDGKTTKSLVSRWPSRSSIRTNEGRSRDPRLQSIYLRSKYAPDPRLESQALPPPPTKALFA